MPLSLLPPGSGKPTSTRLASAATAGTADGKGYEELRRANELQSRRSFVYLRTFSVARSDPEGLFCGSSPTLAPVRPEVPRQAHAKDDEPLPLGLIPLATRPHPEPAPLTPLSDSTGAGDSSDASRLQTVEGTPIEENEDEAAQAYVNEKQYARVIRRREFKAERALNAEQNGERLNSTSRQEHAHRRPRGPHGRFLGAGETPPVLAKPVMRARRQEMMVMADAPAGFSEKEFFEYHLYTLGRQVDLPDRSIKQLELFEPVFAVDCERTLRVESGGWWGYPVEPNTGNGYPFSGERNVNAHVTFKNVEAVGLGIPLPKGRVRVSQEDTDGSLEFIGEDTIDHTPRKETVDLLLGQAFDVVAERKQADFRWSKGDRWMEEIVEVEIRNRKREPVRLEIREHLFRWSNWDINQSSEEFEKVDASTVDFSMMVPADDERTLTYTVRYTW